MYVIEASRRSRRAAVERIRTAFIQWDRIVFKTVSPPPEECYSVIRDGKSYVLVVNDPTL